MFFEHSRTPSLEAFESNPFYEAWLNFKSRGLPGFDLSVSNPTQTTLPSIRIADDVSRDAIHAPYEASPQGLATARNAIAAMTENAADPECIQLYASTSEAVGAIIKLLCAPGDEIVTCSPTYPLLDCLASLESVTLKEVALQDCAGRWAIDFYQLERAVHSKTRAIIIVSPNNPTGHIILRDEMETLVRFCAARDIAIIVDEVFAAYRINPDSSLMPQNVATYFNARGDGLVISLSGLSKVCGLPQHKLGWGIFGGDPQIVREAMQRMSFITDSTLSVSGWVQRIAPYLLQKKMDFEAPCLQRIQQNLDILKKSAADVSSQWRVDPIDGGWSACIRLPNRANDIDIATQLASNGIRIFPGTFFGYETWQPTLVASLITDPVILCEGIAKMAKLLNDML